jgi:hypothetical protein
MNRCVLTVHIYQVFHTSFLQHLMKCTIPEISWHNRDPVLSVDIQLACKNENFERLATGGTDSHVVVSIQNTEHRSPLMLMRP